MAIGKIFYSSWGYEQTNIDFYKVVEVSKSGKSISLQPIGSKSVGDNGWCSEEVIPDENKLKGEVLTNRRLMNSGSDRLFVNVSERSDYKVYAYEWDGSPKTQTSYY